MNPEFKFPRLKIWNQPTIKTYLEIGVIILNIRYLAYLRSLLLTSKTAVCFQHVRKCATSPIVRIWRRKSFGRFGLPHCKINRKSSRKFKNPYQLELINASFKRVKVPFQWEIYPEDKIREIDQFITFVRSRFAEVGLPDLPEYYRNSKNEDHKLIKASRLERISNNMKG